MKKKLLSLLFAVMTASFVLSACGSDTKEDTKAEEEATDNSDAEDEAEDETEETVETIEGVEVAGDITDEIVRADADEEAAEIAEMSGEGTVEDPYIMGFDNMTDAYSGSWYETGLGFDVLMPDEWTETETEEEGVTAEYISEEEDITVAITSAEDEESDDLTKIYEELQQTEGISNTVYTQINGLSAVRYESDDAKTITILMLDEDGNRNSVVIKTEAPEDYEELIADLIFSISTTE